MVLQYSIFSHLGARPSLNSPSVNSLGPNFCSQPIRALHFGVSLDLDPSVNPPALRAGLHYGGEGLRDPVGQECLAKTWLYEANGGYAGEELKAIKYFYWVGLLRRRSFVSDLLKLDKKLLLWSSPTPKSAAM
jgi:hypothetical protein